MNCCRMPGCGSYAVSPHRFDREPGVDLDLCDAHYWQVRAQRAQAERDEFERLYHLKDRCECGDDEVCQIVRDRDQAKAEAAELRALFDLQHSRVAEAEALWRQCTSQPETTVPDLGALVGWLVSERRRLVAALMKYMRLEAITQAMNVPDDA